jgi:dephospho-CoA kinase
MYIVGLTGGIGSGKTAAANRFRSLGVTVVNADDIAREVVAPGTPALETIAKKFGAGILNQDGSLNRSLLRKKIFGHEEYRSWLEKLLHPLIGETTDKRLQAPKTDLNEPPYRILEAPLLLETNGQHRVKRILLIQADRDQRIKRVVERDSTN